MGEWVKGEPKYEHCRTCAYYIGTNVDEGVCTKFQNVVTATQVCEDYEYKPLTDLSDHGAEMLRDAIVKRVATDFKKALFTDKDEVDSCERFFRSEYYRNMCSLDGERIIKMLKEPIVEKQKRAEKNGLRTYNRRYVEYNGERLSVAEWSRKLNIPYSALMWRLYNGWTVERALTEGWEKNE